MSSELEAKLAAELQAQKGAEADTDDGQENSGGKPELITIKRGGEARQVTKDELVAMAQKGWDADQKYQEAAGARKLQEDIQAARLGDMGALLRVAKNMGATDEQVQQYMAEYEGRKNGGAQHTPNPQNRQSAPAAEDDEYSQFVQDVAKTVAAQMGRKGPVGFKDLDARVQGALESVYGELIQGKIQNTIDTDAVLGDYMKYGSPEQKDAVREMVSERVQRRMSAGQDWRAPGTMSAVVQEVRQALARLGTQPTKKQTRVPIPGLGPSDGGLASEFHPDKPAKRPEKGVWDAKGSEYVLDRLRHIQLSQSEDY